MSFYDAIRIGASGAADFEVERSLRFVDEDQHYLTRTPGSAGNRKTWTLSVWVKRTTVDANQRILTAYDGSNVNAECNIQFQSDGKLQINNNNTSSNTDTNLKTDRLFRDPSAWYHIVVATDMTQGTAANRVNLYINGEQETSFSTESYGTQNVDWWFNNNSQQTIGRRHNTTERPFDGYMAEFNFIDGLQLTPASFGETNSDTDQWIPKKYTGSYGTNGFYLKFQNLDLFTHFTDTSSSQHFITRNGNVIHKSDQTKNGATSIYFDGSGDTLTVPDSTDFTVGSNDFTIEAYVRRTSQGSDEWFFVQSDGTTANTSIGLHIGSSSSGYANRPSLRYTEGSTGNELQGTTTLAANTWYHIAGVRQGNTVRIYVNGTQEATASYSGTVNDSSGPVVIGAVNAAGSAGLTGYLDQLRWSNSCRYPDGTSFTPPTTQFTADSNTKLLVQSNVTGDLGSDSSGNGNNFTPNNFVVGDAVKDTPTNNFAGLRMMGTPFESGAGFSEGNLELVTGSTNSARNLNRQAFSPMLVNSGKWYAEFMQKNSSQNAFIGVGPYQQLSPTQNNTRYAYVITSNGQSYVRTAGSESISTYGASIAQYDVVGVYIDMDAGTPIVYFSKNGQWADGSGNFDESNPTGGITLGDSFFTTDTGGNDGFVTFLCSSAGGGTNVTIQANFGQDSTFSGQITAGGNTDANALGDFKYPVPTGAKALCSANLPDPTILLPEKHFNTLVFTGNQSTNAQTGLDFQPDWVVYKALNPETGHGQTLFHDSVRGSTVGKGIRVHNAETPPNEVTNSSYLVSFDSNGITVGNDGVYNNYQTYNQTGRLYQALCWNGGNSDGATYRVVVVSDSGNKYRFRNSANTATFAQSAVTLDLAEGGTYIFDQSDSSNAGHPLRFSTTANGTHGGGSEYTTGVTTNGTPGSSGAYTQIVVAASAPTLYYYCTQHSGMGGQANTNSTLGSSNFDGATQSRVKVNTSTGFSMVTYTGTGSTTTVGHGLGAKPDAMIFFNRNNESHGWLVYHKRLGATKNLQLNSNSPEATASNKFNDTEPTSTVFTLNTAADSNQSGQTIMSYHFTAIEGYSKFGFYRANSNNDGPFAYCGFEPAFLLIKRRTSGDNNPWIGYNNVRNPFNQVNNQMVWNTTEHENIDADNCNLDFLSNGFKLRNSEGSFNNSGSSGEYIFLAFAHSPFKNGRAR